MPRARPSSAEPHLGVFGVEGVCLGDPSPEVLRGIDPKHHVEHHSAHSCGLVTIEALPLCQTPCRPRAWNYGPVFGVAAVFGGCAHNLMHACALRHLAVQPPSPPPDAFDWFLQAVNAPGGLVDRYHSEMEPWRFSSVLEWMARWPRSKSEAIFSSITRGHKYAPSVVRLFIKTEVTPVLWLSHGFPSAHPVKPRMIQAYANLATQASRSYEVASVQAKLFHIRRFSVGDHIDCTVACGMTPIDVAAWCCEVERDLPNGFWLELDASSFDATIQRVHYELKMAVYRALGVTNPTLDFLAAGFRVRGVSITALGGRVETRTNGTVKSGHADTTLGNSIINSAVICSALHDAGCRAAVIVAGDDALVRFTCDVRCARMVAGEVCDRVAFRGLKPKAALHQVIERASFISLCFFRSACGSLVASPKPGKQLAKLFWSIRALSERERAGYLRCVCDGMLVLCPDIPVLSPWLRAVRTANAGGRDYSGTTGVYILDGLTPSCARARYDLTDSFCSRYGFSRSDLLDLESHVVRCDAPGIYHHPLVERMKEIDLGDFCGEEPVAMVGRERR